MSPLWRQEGFDLLYQVKNYKLSLHAFQNAIATLDSSTALYGVANPLDIYFGASIAAISVGNEEKAKEYYQEFTLLFETFWDDPKLEKSLMNYKDGIKWIGEDLS